MSGLCGIVNTDGQPIDRRLLEDMTASLRFRGTDRQQTWASETVGFGHTLLATTHEAWRERQPGTLDGDVWITADARIDDRKALVATLTAHGGRGLDEATDPDLILHAYRAWGDACVDRLIGDFAFAIWDGRSRRLFCARDRFGVRPFFFAVCRGALVFSNTLDCVRRHPAVSAELDDLAIADFLLFQVNLSPEMTTFRDVRRLPAAHTLTWSPGAAPRVRQYWTPSLDREIRYRRGDDYVEHFREVFGRAVDDRLRAPRVTVSMSGGLDSTFVAATAHALAAKGVTPCDVRVHTIVRDRVIPCEERHYAGLVVNALGLPARFFSADDYALFDRWNEPNHQLSELGHPAFRALWLDSCAAMASDSRVALSGIDADGLLNELALDYFEWCLRTGRFVELAGAMVGHVRWLGRRPPLGLRALAARVRGAGNDDEPPFPAWIAPELTARLDLRTRWHDYFRGRAAMRVARRPRQALGSPFLSVAFETRDAASTRVPLEFRYPFADSRVVDFVLSVPTVPWCADKALLRIAGRGLLPDAVRLRKKSPLPGRLWLLPLKRADARWIDAFQSAPGFETYVTRSAVPRVTGAWADAAAFRDLRPLVLNWWLGRHVLTEIGRGNHVEGDRADGRHEEAGSIA